MLTLRCTQKLLDHFSERPTPVALTAEPGPLLGDWYAKLVCYGDTSIALCVSDQTRYAIVIPLDGCDGILSLYIHLAQRIHEAMRRAGIAEATCRDVLEEHRGGVRIARTKSRSVLGTMNDLAKHLDWHLEQMLERGPVRDPAELEDELNKIPHRPLGWSNAKASLVEVCGGAGPHGS